MHGRVTELLEKVMSANGLTTDDVISVLFTATDDLRSAFPAVAARAVGFDDVPLICARELGIESSLPRAVRLMLHVETERSRAEVVHVFLHGAAVLRPDLAHLND